MPEVGYAVSSEEHSPDDAIDNAVTAEQTGFEYALVSDHFHPWISQQGHAPFVWSTLAGIARETESLRVGTGVTCPIQRIHPVNVAHAAATTAELFDDRFFFGVGTGEQLNEHVTGERWPPFDVRIDRLEEAVDVIRQLFTGQPVTHRGEHFTVEQAKLFTTPDDPPPIIVAGAGETAVNAAADFGDGYCNTAPTGDLVESYDGDGPKYGQVAVCYAEDDATARERAHKYWPNVGIEGEITSILPTVTHFEQITEMVSEEKVAQSMTCSSDPQDHIDAIEKYADAGFDHVYVHQVGPAQDDFFDVYEAEVLPSFS